MPTEIDLILRGDVTEQDAGLSLENYIDNQDEMEDY